MSHTSPGQKTLQARVLSGSAILLGGSALAAAISFGYNIAVAKFLGPAEFGHATAIYTILILVSSATLSFQIVSAKIVAQKGTAEAKSAAYRDYHRAAWLFGISTAALLLVFARGIADYLKVPSPLLVTLIAIGVAFYVPLGNRRGFVQGACSFRKLAANLILEGAVRLVGSVILILAGFGVKGVIAANAAAVIIAYFAIPPKLAPRGENPFGFKRASSELLVAIAFFSGAALINNSGIVLVKHYFPAVEAGLYAAVAMVGRVIFAFASAVVNGMFPIVAGTQTKERRSPRLITTPLLLVLGIGCLSALCLWLAPSVVWRAILGSGFEIGGANRLSYLMPLYAVMTTIYSLSVVLITYEMAYKVAGASWIQLGMSGLVIAAICLYHQSLQQVIWVQFALMIALLLIVGLPFFLSFKRTSGEAEMNLNRPLQRVRRVSEDEVIAGFLKNDFQLALFRAYQDRFLNMVLHPNLEDARENQIRRSLLFLRHRPLWAQLPSDTEWYEVALDFPDLDKVRVFPRAQWTRLARGDYSLERVVGLLRSRKGKADEHFRGKIAQLQQRLARDKNAAFGSVLLIGASDSGPFTILDGNHRLVAAALNSPMKASNLQFYCGLSPKMTRCCWYKTSFPTLVRYAFSRATLALHDSKSELETLLASTDAPSAAFAGGDLAATNGVRDAGLNGQAKSTEPATPVQIVTAPERAGSENEQKEFLTKLESEMAANRPRVVLDCSGVLEFDKPFVRLLFCCLEEAMKRNGDLRLAEPSGEAQAALEAAGAHELLQIFDTVREASESFQPIHRQEPAPATAQAGAASNITVVDGPVKA